MCQKSEQNGGTHHILIFQTQYFDATKACVNIIILLHCFFFFFKKRNIVVMFCVTNKNRFSKFKSIISNT